MSVVDRLDDPDTVGELAYRTLYDMVVDSITDAGVDAAVADLDAAVDWARVIRARLVGPLWGHSLPDGNADRYWIETDDELRPDGYDDVNAGIDAAKALGYEPRVDRDSAHESVYLVGVPEQFIGTSLTPPKGDHVQEDMQEPHACDECGEIYDETCGDGYMGLCPSCADKSEPAND